MRKNRKSIRLTPDEDQLLRTLHRQSGVPDGQFPQRPQFWTAFTAAWNEATGRSDTPEEVLHYIVTQRKKGRWFRFDGAHKVLSAPGSSILTPEQWAVVDEIYVELGIAADNFLFDRALRTEVLRRFTARTGVHLPDLIFAAAIIRRRKEGELPKTGKGPSNIAFGDIDDVG